MPSWILFFPIGCGALIFLLGIPLMRRKIRPNRLYGFRTRKTLGDERIWYEANAYAGKVMVSSGLTATAVGTAFLLLLKSGAIMLGKDATALLLLALLLIPVLVMTVLSLLKLRRM